MKLAKKNISQTQAITFWNDIWSLPSTQNQNARWLQRVSQVFADIEKQWDIKIMVESVRKCVSGMLNWVAHGPDHVQSLWF